MSDACHAHGISEQTCHRWKAKYGGFDVSDARRLKALEDENRRLKAAAADPTLADRMLKDVPSKSGEGLLLVRRPSPLFCERVRCK